MGALNGLGAALRLLRKRRGWNQDEVASAAGVRRATVSDWETGATFPDSLDKILDGLGASLYDLAAARDEASGGARAVAKPQETVSEDAVAAVRQVLPRAPRPDLERFVRASVEKLAAEARLADLQKRYGLVGELRRELPAEATEETIARAAKLGSDVVNEDGPSYATGSDSSSSQQSGRRTGDRE